MTKTPLVSIGLVTWNSGKVLPACLESLHQQEHVNIELTIVDNASEDDSVSIAHMFFPDAHIVENSANMGYCHAHNLAIRDSRGEYYLALNPDVILKPNYISSLVQGLREHPDCGSVAGKLWKSIEVNAPNRIDTTGLFINRYRRQILRGHDEEDLGQYDIPGEVFGVDGAAPLYRRAMLEDVQIDGQYFDEQFFAHKEDVDLAWRAKLFGWRCWYVPDANALHPRSFRPGKRRSMSLEIRTLAIKNRYLLLIKNEDMRAVYRDASRIIAYDMLIFAYILLFEQSSLAAFRSLRHQMPQAKKWRKHIWERVQVSTDEIQSWFSF